MKKSLLVLTAIVMLLAGYVYAQTADNPSNTNDMQTNFAYIGVMGNTQNGNPGYIAFKTTDVYETEFTYYLWVNELGKLVIGSYPTVSAYSSFPSGDWDATEMPAGTVVGGQS